MKKIFMMDKIISSSAISAALLVLGYCSTVAAPRIAYDIDELQYFEGQAGATYTPTLVGTPTSCNTSPDLPAGLTIHPTTCAISGTPSVASAQKTYTVTAKFAGTAPHGVEHAATQIKLGAMSMTATRVYGQADFTSNVSAQTTTGVTSARGVAVDSTGVYLIDGSCSRILFFPHGSTVATRVYGQGGSFTACNTGTSSTALNEPSDIAVYGGDVYVADSLNNRVLKFSGTSTTASVVYGQADMVSSGSSCSATGLNYPAGVFANASGLYVAEESNHRVLFYAGTSTTPSRVYGQANYTSCAINRGGSAAANTFNRPVGLAVSDEGLYVGDAYNYRVLFFTGTSDTVATRVYGQPDFSTTTNGVSKNRFSRPHRVFATKAGLFVSDITNYRVLFFAGKETSASGVLGQEGSFTSANSAVTSRGFSGVWDIAQHEGGLYVADSARRMLYFP